MLSLKVTLVALLACSRVCGFHEKRELADSDPWIYQQREVPQETNLLARVFLTQIGLQDGHKHLMDVSDPTSPKYGQHWTPAMVQDFFSPSQSTFNLVKEWLIDSGIDASRQRAAQGSISFTASVAEMEHLLNTSYNIWENTETRSLSIACDEYHVPDYLQDVIDYVTPTIGLGLPKVALHDRADRKLVEKIAPRDSASCADLVTPRCIQDLYGIPEPGVTVPGNDLGIFETGNAYAQEDLDLFFKNYYSLIPNGTHPQLLSIDGGTAPVPLNSSGGESTLDFDCAYPIIWPQGIKLYQTLSMRDADNFPQNFGALDTFLDAIDGSYCTYDGGDDPSHDPTFPSAGYPHAKQCGVYKSTSVISFSYAIAESYYPLKYLQRQCYEYMKLGLQGVSLIFASGDNGTITNSPYIGCLKPGGRDNPNFPATCPYVLSVGATQLAGSQERAALDFGDPVSFSSGGGFSNVFPRPSYQAAAVKTYLAQSHRSTALFNASNRGYPDVSAIGFNIATYIQGTPFADLGTSASAPIVAAIVNRINGERLLIGKKPLGFLNPIFYAHPEMFNDITQGYNLGCNSSVGFTASTGWDPVTGLGTPNFARMTEVLLSLP